MIDLLKEGWSFSEDLVVQNEMTWAAFVDQDGMRNCVCVKERDRSCWWSAESWLVDSKDHSGILAFWRRKWQPLQCSRLENPRDGGAWWAAVYGVAQSRTWLKRLSRSQQQLFFSTFYWHAFVMWHKNFALAQNLVFVSYIIINTPSYFFLRKVTFNIIKIAWDLEWVDGSFVLLKRSAETCRLAVLKAELVGHLGCCSCLCTRLCTGTGSRLHGTIGYAAVVLKYFSKTLICIWNTWPTPWLFNRLAFFILHTFWKIQWDLSRLSDI